MNKKKGFTIIELIVVIAIIGVLSSIVSANVIGLIRKARNAKRLIDVENYVKALQAAYVDDGVYPAGDDDQNYCCLGISKNGNVCSYSGTFVPVCSDDPTNDVLKKYISGLPADDYKINNAGTDYWGYVYTPGNNEHSVCWNGGNPSEFCVEFSINWPMEGNYEMGDSCGVGNVDYVFPGGAYCYYFTQ